MDWRCNAARAAISSRTSSGTSLMVICTGMNALCHQTQYSESNVNGVLVQTGKRIGDNGIWCIAKRNGILYLPDVDSKTTSFSSAFAGIFASN